MPWVSRQNITVPFRSLLALELYDPALKELEFARGVWGDSPVIQATTAWINRQKSFSEKGTTQFNLARASFTDSDPLGGNTLVSGLERNRTLDGAVWGGGVEYALSDWFTLKVEYLRYDISDTLTETARSAGGSSFRFAHHIEDIDTVKVGFNIKFNRDVAPMK
jgi:opacity protein-like surface antigen